MVVDGQFGSKTQAAVKDYQKKNGLVVDGIVGTNTWGKINSSGSSSTKKKSKSTTSYSTSSSRPTYKKSQSVKNAEKALSDWEKNPVGDYSSKYADEIDSILNSILNREEFSYNLNADPLYEQYRELYSQNGKKAMADTVGKVSSLTGGYGSSYATTAGVQAYDEYLSGLNDVALDLRDRAYNQYNDETEKMVSDVQLLRLLDGDDYDKYLDTLERYYKDGEYLLDKLTSMSDSEFEKFLAEVDAWESDRDYAFKEYQDAKDREEFEREMAFKKEEAKRDQANADRSYALALSRANSSSSKSNSGKSKNKTEVNKYPVTYKEFVLRTGYDGIMTKNEFDTNLGLKARYGSYKEYLYTMYKKYGKES